MSIPFTQGCFVLSLAEIGQVVLEKKIVKVCHLPLQKDVALHLNKLEFPSQKDALCQVEIGPVVLVRKMKMGKVNDNEG